MQASSYESDINSLEILFIKDAVLGLDIIYIGVRIKAEKRKYSDQSIFNRETKFSSLPKMLHDLPNTPIFFIPDSQHLQCFDLVIWKGKANFM